MNDFSRGLHNGIMSVFLKDSLSSYRDWGQTPGGQTDCSKSFQGQSYQLSVKAEGIRL